MPKHHDKPHKHHKHHRSSAVDAFVDADALDDALAPWLPDRHDRAFVLRCVLDEGPAHHRGSNFVLLSLLVRLCQRLGVTAPASAPTRPFPMRLPPHLEDEIDDDEWPLEVPAGAIEALAGDGRAADAMIDCLTDGPPQHAVANVLMVSLLEALLARAEPPR